MCTFNDVVATIICEILMDEVWVLWFLEQSVQSSEEEQLC